MTLEGVERTNGTGERGVQSCLCIVPSLLRGHGALHVRPKRWLPKKERIWGAPRVRVGVGIGAGVRGGVSDRIIGIGLREWFGVRIRGSGLGSGFGFGFGSGSRARGRGLGTGPPSWVRVRLRVRVRVRVRVSRPDQLGDAGEKDYAS